MSDQVNSLTEDEWDVLLSRIKDERCTPLLGAGVCHGVLKLGTEIAEEWAKGYGYPLIDNKDLARVAQYLAIRRDAMYPKEELPKIWLKEKDKETPDFSESDEPHSVLAQLPIPLYLTTNYDDFMISALKHHGKKPKRYPCKWNSVMNDPAGLFDPDDLLDDIIDAKPTLDEPAVFHLHGCKEVPTSMVLTEDDYLEFLVNITDDRKLIPLLIQRSIAGTSLMFIGYSLSDWTFRVVHRGIVSRIDRSLRRISVTVQLPPLPKGSKEAEQQQDYLTKYFKKDDIRVFWGTAKEFAAELNRRWRAYNG